MTALAAWSWITAAVSIIQCWISSHNPRKGWLFGIAAQSVWVIDGIVTGQPGTIALSVALTCIYIRALYRWHGTDFTPDRKKTNGTD
ncbi:hypothetical protein [Nocardia jiangxiensis]|uniref:hypothetical protein n=1 Tax=Nocardia jiangxiensis TaxID=282685 RepID=UPI000301CA42|nr:hypothetical protein [Nocardia jiangxiensis]